MIIASFRLEMVGEDIVDISRYTTAPCAVGVFQSLDDLHEIGVDTHLRKAFVRTLVFQGNQYISLESDDRFCRTILALFCISIS